MQNRLTTVVLVLGHVTRERLLELLHRAHVWLVATPAHANLERELWTEHRATGLPGDVTSFVSTSAPAEERIAELVASIDKHHDERARDGAWTTLEVLGAELTHELRAVLERYGAVQLSAAETGFVARRA
jgi:hypothetical protein